MKRKVRVGFKKVRLIVLAAVSCVAVNVSCGGEFNENGCTVKWEGKTLSVGNALFSRRYESCNGVLRTVSFKAKDGMEWQRAGAPAGQKRDDMEVSAAKAKWSPVGTDGVRVTVKAAGKQTELDIYPGMPGVIVRRSGVVDFTAVHDSTRQIDRLKEDREILKSVIKACDYIAYTPLHMKVTSMTCLDQTDIRDNLVHTQERLFMAYDEAFSVSASSVDCRDVLTGEGMVFVRLAPMPVSRPKQADDFILDGRRGIALLANGYPLVELVYRGGDAGRQRAVIAFQRALRPYRPGRDGVLLSNTWGAGNRDSRINQEFLLKEIEAGAKIGVDVIQIDDGWQHGRTANSRKKANEGKKKVWNGYWAADPDFWREDRERFPDGLELLVKTAAAKGMRFGLWFGPDSSGDSENWEKDAACLLDYHKRLGIDYFKMDSMKLYSPIAFQRNRMMFDRMLEQSNGTMVFDLDSTAEVRPGFLGLVDIGPIFVENRGTKRGVYWAHHTLKNLWDLSHIIDPVRLRFEFNNPDTNHDVYKGLALSHADYRPDALFATVMTASPLAWMELSDVSEKSIAALAPLVRSWKAERTRWHGGVIHPVGNRPDGVAWTGFVSEAADGGGYVLLFREFNDKDSYVLDLEPIFGKRKLKVDACVGGRGSASLDGFLLSVKVPEKLDFIWLRMADM